MNTLSVAVTATVLGISLTLTEPIGNSTKVFQNYFEVPRAIDLSEDQKIRFLVVQKKCVKVVSLPTGRKT